MDLTMTLPMPQVITVRVRMGPDIPLQFVSRGIPFVFIVVTTHRQHRGALSGWIVDILITPTAEFLLWIHHMNAFGGIKAVYRGKG